MICLFNVNDAEEISIYMCCPPPPKTNVNDTRLNDLLRWIFFREECRLAKSRACLGEENKSAPSWTSEPSTL